ncbi:hypothetical protein GS537_06420 [Saccharibacter sp. EH60]|nr:hypothetical protein [Saccharibacter sp. EH60]
MYEVFESPITVERWSLILRVLAEDYPASTESHDLQSKTGLDAKVLVRNVAYLKEYGLVQAKFRLWEKEQETGDERWEMSRVTLTAQGYDRLLEDGGLGRILSTVPIILDNERIRDLLMEVISATKGDESLKSKLRSTLKNLPADGMKAVCMELIKSGLSHSSDVLALITKIV